MCSFQDNTRGGKNLTLTWLTTVPGNWFNQRGTSQELIWSLPAWTCVSSVCSCVDVNETCEASWGTRLCVSSEWICGFCVGLLMHMHAQNCSCILGWRERRASFFQLQSVTEFKVYQRKYMFLCQWFSSLCKTFLDGHCGLVSVCCRESNTESSFAGVFTCQWVCLFVHLHHKPLQCTFLKSPLRLNSTQVICSVQCSKRVITPRAWECPEPEEERRLTSRTTCKSCIYINMIQDLQFVSFIQI